MKKEDFFPHFFKLSHEAHFEAYEQVVYSMLLEGYDIKTISKVVAFNEEYLEKVLLVKFNEKQKGLRLIASHMKDEGFSPKTILKITGVEAP